MHSTLEHVIYADLDDTEGVVLNLKTKNYYRLNETGQLVWKGMLAGESLETIASKLMDTYSVDQNQASADVKELVSQFATEQLIGEANDPVLSSMEAARLSKKRNPIRSTPS